LKALWRRLDVLRSALEGDMSLLYRGETVALLRERYRDAVADFGDQDAQRFEKVPHIFDHLEYDWTHNQGSLPEAARLALSEALPLCEALCDILVPLEVAMERRAAANGTGTGSDHAGPLLNKLRWDLRVASGANLGHDESEHLKKHEALYAAAAAATSASAEPCVRTRLYFTHNSHLQGLLAAMLGAQGIFAEQPQFVPRLGFLSHIIVQLWRRRSDGQLNVTCHYSRNGTEERRRLFSMPLVSVDEWWSGMLQAREARRSS
jgi:hypothetical protein